MIPLDKKLHIVPPGEMRCVWMTAGILSYQLCDREFDCERCPLDTAIRNHLPGTKASHVGKENGALCRTAQMGLREDLSYSRNHCWARRIGSGLVQVGIEQGLSEALLTPKAIVFPSPGQQIHRGQTSLWIVMEGGTLPVESPLDGIVRETNHELSNQPHLLNLQPFDNGWLFKLEVEDPSLHDAGLMNREQADSEYVADHDAFLASLQAAASTGYQTVGATLADGGQRLQSISDMLGPKKYFALLKKAFC